MIYFKYLIKYKSKEKYLTKVLIHSELFLNVYYINHFINIETILMLLFF